MALFDRLPRNLGSKERPVRLIVGIALVLLAVTDNFGFGGALVRYGAGLAGVVLIFTAFAAFCPLYHYMRRDED